MGWEAKDLKKFMLHCYRCEITLFQEDLMDEFSSAYPRQKYINIICRFHEIANENSMTSKNDKPCLRVIAKSLSSGVTDVHFINFLLFIHEWLNDL